MPLFYTPAANFQDDIGSVLNNAKLYFYENRTTTDKLVYQDPELTVEHQQPVEADGAGDFPNIWLAPGGYTVELRDSENVLKWKRNDVNVDSTGLLGSSLVGFRDHNDLKSGTTITGLNVTHVLDQTLFTQGYDDQGDGGQATYIVVPDGTGTVDDILYLALDTPGVIAERLRNPITDFDVISNMEAALWLGVGDIAMTTGQTTANDGNGAFYLIVAPGTGTADGYNLVDLGNANQAQRLTLNVA